MTEHTETVDVPVREERVIIERTSVGDQPAPGAVVGDDQTIEVPVMRERVWAEKEAVVAEEVEVRTETVERTEHVEATLRREELAVEGDEGLIAEGSDVPRTGEYQREQSRRE